jgi:hypothetical protein
MPRPRSAGGPASDPAVLPAAVSLAGRVSARVLVELHRSALLHHTVASASGIRGAGRCGQHARLNGGDEQARPAARHAARRGDASGRAPQAPALQRLAGDAGTSETLPRLFRGTSLSSLAPHRCICAGGAACFPGAAGLRSKAGFLRGESMRPAGFGGCAAVRRRRQGGRVQGGRRPQAAVLRVAAAAGVGKIKEARPRRRQARGACHAARALGAEVGARAAAAQHPPRARRPPSGAHRLGRVPQLIRACCV